MDCFFDPDEVLSFHDNGQVQSGTLIKSPYVPIEADGDESAVNGFTFKSSTMITFYSDGGVQSGILSGISGFLKLDINGDGTIEDYFAESLNVGISFYESQRVMSFTLRSNTEPLTIGDNTYVFKGNTVLSVYESGAVKQGTTTDDDSTTDDVEVMFDEDILADDE